MAYVALTFYVHFHYMFALLKNKFRCQFWHNNLHRLIIVIFIVHVMPTNNFYSVELFYFTIERCIDFRLALK